MMSTVELDWAALQPTHDLTGTVSLHGNIFTVRHVVHPQAEQVILEHGT